jgi:hypothetical protein
VRFEVLTAAAVNITVSFDVMPCSLEKYLPKFCRKRLFDREDGGSTFRAPENY